MSRLLIVDDNQQNLYMLDVLLSSNGFQTELASNGAEALERARSSPPDMIISDILMPVMDGYALCRAWKEDERLRNIPFIFYTATYTDPKDEEFALRLGADRFIVKPVEPGTFLALILETRDNFEAGKAVAAPKPLKETEFYQEYNATLIHKLEDKMLQLEEANRILERDITRRKRAEDALRESEEFKNAILDSVSSHIAVLDRDGVILSVNDPWVRFSIGNGVVGGLPARHTEPGANYLKVCRDSSGESSEGAMAAHDGIKAVLDGALPSFTFEYPCHSPGVQRWFIMAVTPLGMGERGVVLSHTDITGRKLAEEALRLSEARFSTIFHASPVSIAVERLRDSRLMDVNDAWMNVTGLTREETIGKTTTELNLWVNPGDRERLIGKLSEHNTVHDYELRLRHKSGSISEVLVSAELIELAGERCVLSLAQDITRLKRSEEERTRAEAQLTQVQKMEALGTLAGGIAHDFNNILGVIVGYSEIAQVDADDPVKVRQDLCEVLKGAARAKDLVRQILAFSRRGEREKKPVEVGLIVKEALKMLRASLPSTIEIKQNVASRAVVMADPTQIHQVLMNLCTNSAQAMRGDVGMLQVDLTDVRLGPGSIPPHSELGQGPHVMLSVKDTGHGIDPSILDRIFDPFFTTKEQGVGTGLGLSVVHGIVKSQGGAIVTESLPGEGTTFHVFFPAIEAAAELPAAAAVPLARGQERILVVDDEPSLAKATKQMLERLGYEVEFRTNGVDALDAIRHESAEKPFDLVITDMTMPHLTGVGLARELSKLRPRLAVLLYTGFSENIDAEKAKSLGIQGFIMKPVVLRELAAAVRKVLDKSRE